MKECFKIYSLYWGRTTLPQLCFDLLQVPSINAVYTYSDDESMSSGGYASPANLSVQFKLVVLTEGAENDEKLTDLLELGPRYTHIPDAPWPKIPSSTM